MLVRPAARVYRTWIVDSRRWDHYRPRPTDIVIATYPKCGTTWMQRIVGLLVFQSPEPRPIMQISAWIDRRFPEPIEAVAARIEAQDHRRFLKTHLPFDGLPIHEEVKYVHVARDGRDACMSFHNQGSGFTPEMLDRLDRAGLEDESVGPPLPAHPRRSGRVLPPLAHGRRRAGPRGRHADHVVLPLRADLVGRAPPPERPARPLQRPEGRPCGRDAAGCRLPQHRGPARHWPEPRRSRRVRGHAPGLARC